MLNFDRKKVKTSNFFAVNIHFQLWICYNNVADKNGKRLDRGDDMIKKEMIAMLLAGGQGSRLGVLTSKVAKPAVAFGGK